MNDWRARLRLAVERSGRAQKTIAYDAGIAPETLSRILNSKHAQPAFETVVRITEAAGVRVAWLLEEPRAGTHLSSEDAEMMRRMVEFLQTIEQAARS